MNYIMQASSFNTLLRRNDMLNLAPQDVASYFAFTSSLQGTHSSDGQLAEVVWRFPHILDWHQSKLPLSFDFVLPAYGNGVLAHSKVFVAADPFSQ